jgi:hypothetical protein
VFTVPVFPVPVPVCPVPVPALETFTDPEDLVDDLSNLLALCGVA